jgi:flagellar biosynthesis protein FlhA
MVCCSLLGLLILKGMPILPVMLVFSVFAFCAFYALKNKVDENPGETENNLYEKIKIYPIEIHFNKDLAAEFESYEANFLTSIHNLREHLAYELGFVIPELKILSDKKLNFPLYAISIQGNYQGVHQLHFDKVLALNTQNSQKLKPLTQGVEVRDPSYGLAATWISPEQKSESIAIGYTVCEPLIVLTTHLKEVIYNQIAELLTRTETESLLDQPSIRNLRDELVPGLIPLGHLQQILQHLLEEKVSIRPLNLILEVLIEHAKSSNDPTMLTEIVRSHLGRPICQKLMTNQRALHVLTLAPSLEQKLNQGMTKESWALEPSLSEGFISALAKQVEKMLNERKRPILLCSSALRRPIKQLTQRVIPLLTVLGMNEVPINIQVESFAVVQ